MERQSRRELLEVISQQKEQMTRYETRLKDVVRAYKGLAKEKETLESSLKVITAAVNEERDQELAANEDTEVDTDVESIAESTSSEISNTVGPGSKPKAKLAALSSSLAAVTADKSQAEAKFLADKRKMKKEKDELNNELEKIKKSEEETKLSLEETKSKLIIERHERDKEMQNGKLMLQEMQKLVSEERTEKERLTGEMAELKSKMIVLEDPSKSRQAEGQLLAVKQELDSTRAQLSKTEKMLKEQKQTEDKVNILEGEMNEMKRKHLYQLRGAEAAREAAELRAMEIQGQQEKRVGNLESHLQELSESVGNYEKLRQQDQAAITYMREEIDGLNNENIALASRAASTEPPVTEVEEKINVDKAVDKVLRYKKLLFDAAKAGEIDNLEEVFRLPTEEDYRVKCLQLQEQLDKVQSSEREKSPSGKLEQMMNSNNQLGEISALKTSNQEMRDKLYSLKQKSVEQEIQIKDKSRELSELRLESDKEVQNLRLDNKNQVAGLRLELQEQRERSLTLLEEKDVEIKRLMNQVETAVEEAFFSPDRQIREGSKSPAMLPRKISVDMMEFGVAIKGGEGSTSGPPLHYIQELSRKEVEIKELRVHQFQAETGLRELQLNMSSKEERYQDRIEDLEETIRRLERMTTMSHGHNTEYLKNVVLNYMLSTDMASKNHMLKAIAAVLRLTEKEVKKVIEHNQAWWWKQSKVGGGGASGSPPVPK